MSRVGLGCMRLSTDPDGDDDRSIATITAALDAGAAWLDTAHAYAHGPGDLGHNERLVARALAGRASSGARVVSKCGMLRSDLGRWEPDGRASTILRDAAATAAALGRPADILLLHAPDPKMPLATSLRALLRAKEEGHARAIGLSNVTRGQLEILDADIPLAAVEVALGASDDGAARGGVVAWCKQRRVPVLAHSPLGGPGRAPRLGRDPVLRAIAARHGATPAMIVIAYLLALDELVVPIVGARRPETAESAMRAGEIVLDAEDLAALDIRFPGLAMVRHPPRTPSSAEGRAEVVIVMGIVGSGKTRLAESYVARGYERLNRDTLGGTLRGIAQRLGQHLSGGTKRIVLDNTYVTRASRSDVVRVAHAAGAIVRCVYVDTPAHEARVNCASRMLERYGELLGGIELTKRAKSDSNLFAPGTLFRMDRQLERPSEDEGFASIETIPFVRTHAGSLPGVVMPLELVLEERGEGGSALRLRPGAGETLERVAAVAPVLLYGWRPGVDELWRLRASQLVEELGRGRIIGIGLCPHASGPPVCWCRPPLPGLWVAFARRHGLDPRVSVLVASTPAHRTMAKDLGLKHVEA